MQRLTYTLEEMYLPEPGDLLTTRTDVTLRVSYIRNSAKLIVFHKKAKRYTTSETSARFHSSVT